MNSEPPNKDTRADPYPIRGFWALVVTQFQGAFNDNAFKTLITLYLLSVFVDETVRRIMIPLAMALFTVPYLLFSMYSGALADRNSKHRVIVWTKWLEIFVMLCGLMGFLVGNTTVSAVLLLVTLFLMATQSTLFSPAKYGILPEILPPRNLSWGNGIIQMGTFVAVITGTAISGFLMEWFDTRIYLASVILVVLSVGGLLSSFGVSRPPPADPGRRISWWPWAGMGRYMKLFVADRWLLLTMLGIAYFWFMGSMVQQNVLLFGKETLGLGDLRIGLLLTSIALGIGTGSVAAGYLSGGKIEVGLIPLGAVGLAVFSMLLAIEGHGFRTIMALLMCMGFSGGFYIIPLSANLQKRSPDRVKGGMIATTNFFTFAGMTLSAGTFYLMTSVMKLSPYTVFLISGIMTVAVSAYICILLPVFLARFLLWLLTHTMYRIRVDGRENVPESGGALFVCNHMSTVDAFLVMASTDRLVRFIMFKGFYDKPLIRPVAKVLKGIPIASGSSADETAAALDVAKEGIRNGDVVCIFAEGQISRTGQMLPFRGGFERIMRDLDAPIIPVCLDCVWGSIFSYAERRSFWRMPHRFRRRITVTYGTPMPAGSSAVEARMAVQELAARAFACRKPDQPLLDQGFVAAVRRHPWRMAIADGDVKRMSYLRTLTTAVAVARKLKSVLDRNRMVGVMMPPSVDCALVNIALELMGKVPINLSHSVPQDVLASAARQCELKRVVTSRAFVDKISAAPPADPVYLEDVFDQIDVLDGAVGTALALFCPVGWLERLLGAPAGRTQDDLCTVIFTIGTSGEPEGVMLSHHNIASNIEAIGQLFAVSSDDRILGVLPFSHSFGFTCTLWLPLTMGVGVVYHSDPDDGPAVGRVARKSGATILMATHTMLQNFVENCHSRDFGSLAYVIAGAENMSDSLSSAFEDKFGVRPYEGYGCTECAPVVAVNVPDYRGPGFYQVGHKRGRIGHPLPGVAVRIVEPDTFEPLPIGTPGLLLVKGPNVMMGYLNDPERSREVVRDGWYVTGDVAVLDEDGFISVVGRTARVSKIAGETVSHSVVEEKLRDMMGISDMSLAVVGTDDPEEGEQIVVFHTLDDDQIAELAERLAESDLPEPWRPDPAAFHRIQSMPLLPSGQPDLARLKQFAESV